MADGRQTRDTQAWPAEFTERRALEAHSNKFFLDNPLEKEWFLTFFKHSSISPLDFQILQKQFKGFKPEYLVQGIQGTETRKAAWIDQRCFPDDPKVPGAVRTKGTDLTAKDLWTQLQKPRFGDQNDPDADRILIFIKGPDAAYMLALIATCSPHQVDALRSVIYDYISRETSLSVHLRLNSFSSFAFKFNITFFVTRESGSQDSQVGDNPIELPRRSWRLFQPKSQDQDFEEHKELIIEALQFSFTIYGRDEYRWIGYAFVSSNAEENDREDENQDGGESEDETGQEDSDNDEGEESPFTKDPISLDTQDAEYIRNPRKCFLDVVDIWLLTCFNYFKDTVRELEYSISNNDHNSVDFLDTLNNSSHIVAECLKAVRRILVALERFDKNDYLKFSDPSSFHKDLSPEIAGKLVSISKIYEKFEDLHNSLRELEKTCTRDAANVQAQRSQLNLTLNMKNNDMAKHHTFIACFTILFVYPLSLVPPLFSMTGSIGPVKLSISNFIIILVVLIVAVGLIYSLLGWAIAGWQRKVKEPNGAIQNAVSNRQSRLTDCDLTGQMIASSDIVRSRSWGVLGGSRIRRRVNLSGKTDDEQPEAIELQVV